MWDQSWFMMLLQGLWRHKTNMEQGMLGYGSNRHDKCFLSLNLLESEILLRDQP
jgi:hypothetical protein